MAKHKIQFEPGNITVEVPSGTLVVEAAEQAGIELQQPCGGQGRCGRCVVQVKSGQIRRRSTLRLTEEDINEGYALACQAVVEGDASIVVPEQESIERRLVTDLKVRKVQTPTDYDPSKSPTLTRMKLSLNAPSMDDQIDDWSRVKQAILKETGLETLSVTLPVMRKIGPALREGDWQVTAIIDNGLTNPDDPKPRLVNILPVHLPENTPFWAIAIDIGTTTVSVWLIDLISGEVKAQVAEYNGQISRGEDVVSRIIFDEKGRNQGALTELVLDTINNLIEKACLQVKTTPVKIYKAVIAGNSTMLHLLLNIPATSIRVSPFITGFNVIPPLIANQVGLNINPSAVVDCLPNVASYVGADITSGVLSSGLDDEEETTLFLDVGTNGEIVLGSKDWLVTCACSAGPAFEGAGVLHGMRASKGAIEEIWVNKDSFEPHYRVIGNRKAKGICGSGLISLLAEMFLTGVVDKGGNIKTTLDSPRVRQGEHGTEYVIAFKEDTSISEDIVITDVDINNLLRAKAAIYAGFSVLAESVDVPLETVDKVLIGGSFGKYINVEKAIQIGLLPDMPWENFHFLGNTAILGTYLALLNWKDRERITSIASKMTYIELSADNRFYDAFMSALFLPHTNLTLFPSVKTLLTAENV